jgi:hypothetical protein
MKPIKISICTYISPYARISNLKLSSYGSGTIEGIRRGDDSAKQNRLDVNERIEGSSVEQLLTSRPSQVARPSAPDAAPPGYPHVRGNYLICDAFSATFSKNITNVH